MNDRIERVVVPLDAAAESATAIETAARLAARAKAPLHGIFVEDEDLLSLASLSFARQITLGAGAEPLTVKQVELQLRVAAERARQAIAAAAKRHAVVWSFEGVRGSLQSALSGVSEGDLVVASALSRPIVGRFRLEGRWWASINAAPGSLLMTRRAWETGGAVLMMVRDQSHRSVRLLEAAVRIAEARDTNLTLVCGADLADAKEIENWAMGHLVQHSVPLQVERAAVEPMALRKRMIELDCGVLAIEAGLEEAGPNQIKELVEHLGCDLLVVR